MKNPTAKLHTDLSTIWSPGAPPGVSPETVAADLAVYRRLQCPCGRTGLRLTAQHTKTGRYRILSRCPSCGQREAF